SSSRTAARRAPRRRSSWPGSRWRAPAIPSATCSSPGRRPSNSAAHGQRARNLNLSRKLPYQGFGYGSLPAPGIPPLKEGFGPLAEGFVHLTAPYPLRVPDCTNTCIAELEETIERLREGPDA